MRHALMTLLLAGCAAPAQTLRDQTIRWRDATLVVPPGWRVARDADRLTLRDPDDAVTVTLLPGEGEARAAVAAAWRRVDRDFTLAPAEVDTPPAEGGWEAINAFGYPPRGARQRRALWRSVGGRGWIALVDGDRNALDRRDAHVDTIIESLHPPGLRPERLGRPRAIDAAAVDDFAARALARLSVPGAAVAVLVDGRVVYERVFGVRALGETAPVTPETRFHLGSITKTLTTLMQGTLVDAGLVRWDTPVTTLLPDFALADAEITRQLRLWHMSCACTGMPRQDLEGIFEWDGVTPEQRLLAMRKMRPTTRLGETYQYSNLMVAAGGFAAAHAFAPQRPLGEAYAAAMQAKIFDPIGMKATLDHAVIARGEHARPHALAFDGTTRAMPLSIERNIEPFAPAGGVWATLRDMERYAATELAEGVAPGGRRVASAAAVRERGRMRVRTGAESGYGLGLSVGTYSGLRQLDHHGGAFGFGTSLVMFPDAGVGIVVLTNVRNGIAKRQLPFNEAVVRRIIEALFAEARPLAERQLDYYVSVRQPLRPRAPSADLSWVAALAGNHRNDALGRVTIRATDGGAELDVGEWRSAVERIVAPDGSAQLLLLDPPFAGSMIPIAGDTLFIPGQTEYRFRRE